MWTFYDDCNATIIILRYLILWRKHVFGSSTLPTCFQKGAVLPVIPTILMSVSKLPLFHNFNASSKCVWGFWNVIFGSQYHLEYQGNCNSFSLNYILLIISSETIIYCIASLRLLFKISLRITLYQTSGLELKSELTQYLVWTRLVWALSVETRCVT